VLACFNLGSGKGKKAQAAAAFYAGVSGDSRYATAVHSTTSVVWQKVRVLLASHGNSRAWLAARASLATVISSCLPLTTHGNDLLSLPVPLPPKI